MPAGVEVWHAPALLGGPECLELGQGAAKPDLARRSVHKVNRNKPPLAAPVLWVDCEMSDLSGDRVDDYAAHLTAGSIGTADVGPILNGIDCAIAALLGSLDCSRGPDSWHSSILRTTP